MLGDGLDLVVQDVTLAVDRLTGDCGVERRAVIGDADIEPRIEPVGGLEAEDQFVEPGDQEVGRRVGSK
jgi:hypothetical protein